MKEYIRKIINGDHLTAEEAADAMHLIMEGKATDAQIGSFLTAMKMKGERIDELTAFVGIMREKSLKVNLNGTVALDMCGTGGDNSGTFNISTVASFVVAGAGASVAKHGNRSISSKCGSADLLGYLGVNISLPPEHATRCILDTGIGFLFAPQYHPAMKHAANPRRELGVKTMFNMMGPMTNPAGVGHQLVGVFDLNAAETMARVFSRLGTRRVLVVHAHDGIDEISLSGKTTAFEVTADQPVRKFDIAPEEFGFQTVTRSSLLGDTVETNAEICMSVLKGKPGPHRDIVVLNAGFGLYAGEYAATPQEGIRMAGESIDSGNALRKLRALIDSSNSA
jgi:anthranilate phosphoribosyltransferase